MIKLILSPNFGIINEEKRTSKIIARIKVVVMDSPLFNPFFLIFLPYKCSIFRIGIFKINAIIIAIYSGVAKDNKYPTTEKTVS